MSTVTFIRKQLKVKGKSTHSGRGFYECGVDCSYDELKDKVSNLIPVWQQQGLVESLECEVDRIRVTFDKSTNDADPYYRTLVVSKSLFELLDGYMVAM